MKKQILTVIMPVYNEERTVHIIIKKVLRHKFVGQLIIVDDNSTDKTHELIKKFRDSRILILKNNFNSGKGFSFRAAVPHIKFPIVAIQDADLEYDPSDYLRLITPIVNNQADVVYGSRFLGTQERRVFYFWHHVANRFFTTLSNVTTNLNLSDIHTCFKFFRTDYLNQFTIKENRFGFDTELTAKLAKTQARFYDVSIKYIGRTYEEGKKIRFSDSFNAFYCIFRYKFFD